MASVNKTAYSIEQIKRNLKRLKRVIKGPYVRQVDFATRDRWARRLRDALEARGSIK